MNQNRLGAKCSKSITFSMDWFNSCRIEGSNICMGDDGDRLLRRCSIDGDRLLRRKLLAMTKGVTARSAATRQSASSPGSFLIMTTELL